jgi:cellobiose phosphorylase
LNLGRCFGFAFGHKENGAMFSHMAVMYAYALYHRGFVAEGSCVLEGIYRHCQDFEKARMYPGLPEYVNQRGRGVYPWLTGSASWYLLTLLSEAFGVRGDLGDLILVPKLTPDQFDEAGEAAVSALFAGARLEIVYRNAQRLSWDQWQIDGVAVDEKPYPIEPGARAVRIDRAAIAGLAPGVQHRVQITLGGRPSAI